uniref:diacylglycerol O-acyltransferase n=1 Tax=Moniliophthora roreri TaxID=221103 RepID=A0A0W0FS70_MONRR
MESGRKLSNASRTLSASSLRDRLSVLATTPLKPITDSLHANIELLRTCTNSEEKETADAGGCSLVGVDCADDGAFLICVEADLPADRPYVFGYHPHGIIGMGALATFATEATGFSKAFPGIKPHLLTLASNFKMPFYRDVILAMGICSVSKRSCSNILKAGPGSAITIVVGGAAESLSARPGTADLTLRKRLGFIKVAIQHGADLVPVFSFGENDIYEQMPNEKGTTVYALQKKFQSVFGFTLPLFHGRGLLNYNLGLMPYRRQIVAVIGKPIHVTQSDKPHIDEVMRIQKLYIDELTR